MHQTQTCSSSLIAAMLFWNLSKLQNVEIPNFVFWTRTCSSPPCSWLSESELPCLQHKTLVCMKSTLNGIVGLTSSVSDNNIIMIIKNWNLKKLLQGFRLNYGVKQCKLWLELELNTPAEDCVFPQFGTDLVGFFNHEGQLHGIPMWRNCIKDKDICIGFIAAWWEKFRGDAQS